MKIFINWKRKFAIYVIPLKFNACCTVVNSNSPLKTISTKVNQRTIPTPKQTKFDLS